MVLFIQRSRRSTRRTEGLGFIFTGGRFWMRNWTLVGVKAEKRNSSTWMIASRGGTY